MPVTLVVGCQWGDEGKAKIIDYLSRGADVVVRYQGGANAGHTVVVGESRFAFHLVPSGILYPHVTCILGGGMVIDPIALASEIQSVTERGIDVRGRILVSEQAHLVLPYHIELDRGSELRLGSASIGTTGKGITPAYMDKVGRRGVRMGDLLRTKAELEGLLRRKVRENNRTLLANGMAPLNVAKTVDSLLDVDHGTYPFVTSSSASVGGAVLGAGLPPSSIERVIGIFKAYCTRVGNGPFPTEEKGKVGAALREIGGEYGTTTGRPRRCGWFDGVAGRTVVKLNGVTEIALTKLDVLDSFERIKVCVGYRVGKKNLEYFPTSVGTLDRCKPEYETLAGWKQKINGDRENDLPPVAAAYVERLEALVGCRIRLISLGPDRRAVIDRT